MKNLFLKVILFVLMLTMLVSAAMTVSAMEYPEKGYWANEAIDTAIANGLLRGKDDGKIHSEDYLTRAEMAAIMVRSFGASVKADVSDYEDLEKSAWYYDEFSKAVQMRVFEGDGSGYMHPNDYITREEVFTVVARAMVLSDSEHSVLNKFKDSSEISNWALDYMSIMAKKSYVNGDETGKVNPKKYITRAEFAQLMYNIYKTYYLKTGSYRDTVDTACVMINTESVNLTNVVVKGDLIIGDGANESTIKLTNVTIEGRLLVRGSARIELVNTTVGEMVVVNNYNSVVHFDNYKNEEVFDGIILNTKATFKQRGGGGGSVTPYVTVTFKDNSGNVVDTVTLVKGNSMADENKSLPNVSKSANGYVKNSGISDLYVGANEYTHVINWDWYIRPSNVQDPLTKDWANFTVNTEVEDDIEVLLRVRKFNAFVFVEQLSSISPAGFPFDAYYDTETRFADTLKDILYSNTPLEALKNSGYWDKARNDARVQKILDTDDNIMMLNVMVKFSQILGEENLEKFIVDSAKESFGDNANLEDAFVEYLKSAVGSSDVVYVKEVKDLMIKAFEHVIDDDPNLVDDLEALAHTIMEDPAAFEEITGYNYASFTEDQRNAIIDEVVLKLETPSTERDEIVSTLVDYLFTEEHKGELKDLVHYAMVYLNDHQDERDQLVEDIIDELYRADLDKLIKELKENNQFEINKRIMFVAEGLYDTIEKDYSYENFVASKIPERLEKVFAIYPEEKVKELYEDAIERLKEQIEKAIDDAENLGIGYIDSGVTLVVNPVSDIYIPLYERMVELIEDKISDKYYYKENIYIQELVKLLDPANLFDGSAYNKPNELSGYKIKSLDYYYNTLYKVVVLGDDAMLCYHKMAEEGKLDIDKLTDDYQDLILKYVNIIADTLDSYAKDGTLPNQKLSPIEKAFKEKYPELVNKIVNWYKDSDLNKDYTGEDYQNIQDKVRKAFENINLSTDEFFDLILANKRIENNETLSEYFEMINADKYKLDVKGNILTFLREVTDA